MPARPMGRCEVRPSPASCFSRDAKGVIGRRAWGLTSAQSGLWGLVLEVAGAPPIVRVTAVAALSTFRDFAY